jgi:hypothetical protein
MAALVRSTQLGRIVSGLKPPRSDEIGGGEYKLKISNLLI